MGCSGEVMLQTSDLNEGQLWSGFDYDWHTFNRRDNFAVESDRFVDAHFDLPAGMTFETAS